MLWVVDSAAIKGVLIPLFYATVNTNLEKKNERQKCVLHEK